MVKYFLFALSLMVSSSSLAQQGPVITCVDCEGLTEKSVPYSGSWYNPQQSGSGYLFDIQNGFLLGYYFGYDDEGTPIWRTFQNPLLESDEPGVQWQVSADFIKYTNGNPRNGAFQPPDAEFEASNITVKFRYKHYAEVTVDGGEPQNIVPLNFGVNSSQDFPESEQLFPDLEGMWSFVLTFKDKPFYERLFAYNGHDIYMTPRVNKVEEDGTKSISHRFLHSSNLPEEVPIGSIRCSNPINELTSEREVECHISNQPFILDRMVVAPGDIGPDYIFGQNESGDTFEAFRYNYLRDFGHEPQPEEE